MTITYMVFLYYIRNFLKFSGAPGYHYEKYCRNEMMIPTDWTLEKVTPG